MHWRWGPKRVGTVLLIDSFPRNAPAGVIQTLAEILARGALGLGIEKSTSAATSGGRSWPTSLPTITYCLTSGRGLVSDERIPYGSPPSISRVTVVSGRIAPDFCRPACRTTGYSSLHRKRRIDERPLNTTFGGLDTPYSVLQNEDPQNMVSLLTIISAECQLAESEAARCT